MQMTFTNLQHVKNVVQTFRVGIPVGSVVMWILKHHAPKH